MFCQVAHGPFGRKSRFLPENCFSNGAAASIGIARMDQTPLMIPARSAAYCFICLDWPLISSAALADSSALAAVC